MMEAVITTKSHQTISIDNMSEIRYETLTGSVSLKPEQFNDFKISSANYEVTFVGDDTFVISHKDIESVLFSHSI